MAIVAVGFSDKFVKNKCIQCKSEKAQIVQTQSYLVNIKNLYFFGMGTRNFALQCSDCSHLMELNQNQISRAKTMKYGRHSSRGDEILSLSASQKNKKYPVLTKKRRKKIRSSNFKEGLLSIIIGTLIGFLLLPLGITWVKYISIIVIAYSILGGLYGMLEDPENKHRDLIDHNKEP